MHSLERALPRALKRLVAIVALALASTRVMAVQFVVGEWPNAVVHGDSFVVTLTDPAHISHARQLVSKGPGIGTTILLAKVAPGADGINVDYFSRDRREWSWHVTEVLGFVDMTIEILDGWPTFVESDVPGWMLNTGGRIGFWSYTVVAEVPEPGAAWLLLGGALLLGARGRLAAPPFGGGLGTGRAPA